MDPVTDIQSGDPRRPRLALLGAFLALAVVVMTSAWNRHAVGANITLLYVGADDCAPCRTWRSGDGAAFLASAEFAGITYREVRSAHLDDVLSDANWPEDIRDYRSGIQRSDGVPLWLVIAEGSVVARQFGTTAWRKSVLPTLRSYSR